MATLDEALTQAIAQHHAGQFDAAEMLYRRILALHPQHAHALSLLGSLLLQTGRLDPACQSLQQAIALEPLVASHRCNLGSAYLTAGRYAEASVVLCEAVKLEPTSFDAHYNYGLALYRMGQLDAAVAAYEKCLALRPQFASAMANLGVAEQDRGNLPQARKWFEQAVRLEPREATHHYNLATICKDEGRPAAAIDGYDAALRLHPTYAQAICGRAVALLSMGALAAGWPGYEQRTNCPQFDTLSLPQPRWDGKQWAGTLLIHSEQGLGDTLQFIRYVDRVRKLGSQLIVAVQPALVPLLRQSGYSEVVPRSNPLPPCDVQIPLMSLPHALGTELASIPRDVPYLMSDAKRIAHWRLELAAHQGFKIGISWQGRATFRADRFRSIPLLEFATLANVAGVRLISLQKGHGSEQIAALDGKFDVVDLGPQLDAAGAFLDTAAVMQNLDLVVTSDTAMAHLAGALGVNVWVLLSAAPDWRWLLRTSESPWYPTMRLFRQTKLGDWTSVMAEVAGKKGLAARN